MTLPDARTATSAANSAAVAARELSPEQGPRLLFFSGGTALNGLGRVLKHHTHRSIHLVTPFDSGGSSAALRRAFDMPAIGDLRSRLVALADDSMHGHPEVVALFQQRLPDSGPQAELRQAVQTLAAGSGNELSGIPSPLREQLSELLAAFAAAMPADFDLRGASIGNLILAGGYLQHGRDLRPVIALFSELIAVRGTVLPVVEASLHLGVRLRNGEEIIGQHRITGKQVRPLTSPIDTLFLSASSAQSMPVVPSIGPEVQNLIAQAELICFPPGSFFSSVLANLLPSGVGRAVTSNPAPKVYVPNLGIDPEQLDCGVADCIQRLRAALEPENGGARPAVDTLLIDQQHERYVGLPSAAQLQEWGMRMVEAPLVSAVSVPYYDNEKLAAALLALAGNLHA